MDGHEEHHGIHRSVLDDVVEALGEPLLAVFKAHSRIEQDTGIVPPKGQARLVDVLSHLCTLAHRGPDLSEEQQRDLLARIRTDMARSVIEGHQEVLDIRLERIAERYEEYGKRAAPFREDEFSDTDEAIKDFRRRIDSLQHSAKTHDVDSPANAWMDAAGLLKEATDLAWELGDRLNTAIAAAKRKSDDLEREERHNKQLEDLRALATQEQQAGARARRWGYITGAVGLVLGAGGILIAVL